MTASRRSPLDELAQLTGIQTRYTDAMHQRRKVPRETMVRIAAVLGAEIDRPRDAASAVRAWRLSQWRQVLEPVNVVWQGGPAWVSVRLATGADSPPGTLTITAETGETWSWPAGSLAGPADEAADLEGAVFRRFQLRIPLELPIGYHRVVFEHGATRASAPLLVAPARMYRDPSAHGKHRWGVFLPLYALHSDHGLGAGNFGDWGRLARWAADQGASFVATLPLLACRTDHWDGISPYAPISRLFWNEFFLDLPTAFAQYGCPLAAARLNSAEVQARAAELRALDQVDYPRQAALQRELLQCAAREFFAADSPERQAFERDWSAWPALTDFARFRAYWEQQGKSWHHWPRPQSAGHLGADDVPAEQVRFHAWAQWLAGRQLSAVSEQIDQRGATSYLDLPLGVHGDGYDLWRYREQFAVGVSGGAPPDRFFTQGQNWGFPPLAPHQIRMHGYDYWLAVLRHHLRQARLLRIDHVMGLHRLFWIPDGMPNHAGAYVTYPAHELYATLAIESHRTRSELVGENLGTVPPAVNRSMKRHGLRPTYVAQFALRDDPRRALAAPSREAMAGLNTHDTATWASFWRGLDIDDRADLGLIDAAEALEQHEARAKTRQALLEFLSTQGLLPDEQTGEPPAARALAGLLRYLARTKVDWRVITLEDLWLETRPQNVPGTFHERPNWRQKARHSLETIVASPEVRQLLSLMQGGRREPRQPSRA